jgi:hypothetical protein
LYFNDEGKTDFIPYDFDISLGTNWHGAEPAPALVHRGELLKPA